MPHPDRTFRRPARRSPILFVSMPNGFAPTWPLSPDGTCRRSDPRYLSPVGVAAAIGADGWQSISDRGWAFLIMRQAQKSAEISRFMRFSIGPNDLVRPVTAIDIIDGLPLMPPADGRVVLNLEQAESVTAAKLDWLKSIWIDAQGWMFDLEPAEMAMESL